MLPNAIEATGSAHQRPVSTTDEVRRLVAVEPVRKVRPIPDADAIEAVEVRGWTVVTRKGELATGDLCLFFEIDACLPLDDPRFEFLAPRGIKTLPSGRVVHRLKTARLRGTWSQGLALPLEQFPEALTCETSTDLAESLGVVKWEPLLPPGSDAIGEFPRHLAARTDSERVQNLADVWSQVAEAGRWVPTEKLDGTSVTVGREPDGTVRVASRSFEVGPGSLHYRLAEETGLLGLVHSHPDAITVQAELVGPGIQGNPLRLPEVSAGVFDIWADGQLVGRDGWPGLFLFGASSRVRPAPVLDLPFPGSPQAAVEQVDGMESAFAPGRRSEGVVWHLSDGRQLGVLGWRSTFKAISNRYLLKHDG